MGRNLAAELGALFAIRYKETLDTLNRDSRQIAKAAEMLRGLSDHSLCRAFNIDATPLTKQEKLKDDETSCKAKEDGGFTAAPLSGSRACGAHARQTGKPCKSPAMRGKKRCRLHGGKSTGRPISNGLQASGFIKRKKAIDAKVSEIMLASKP